jgi:hypothetical protein
MRVAAPPTAAVRCASALPRRYSAGAARSRAPQAPPSLGPCRRLLRPCRASSSGADADNSPWWMALDVLFVLTFNPGSADEGIYTTTTTVADSEPPRHAFVAFQDVVSAESLAVRVAAQAGKACVVQGVPPLALLLLGREAGYTVEAVPRGAPWERPDVLLEAPQTAPPEDIVQSTAQRRAATAVRNALLLPLSQLSASMARAAGLPDGAALQQAPGGGDAAPPALPQAASAMATALRAIARRRLEALLPPQDTDGPAS